MVGPLGIIADEKHAAEYARDRLGQVLGRRHDEHTRQNPH